MTRLSRVWSRGLRVPQHRATTAHLCAAYPFASEAGLGPAGIYLGTNLLSGGAFCFDPFVAYQRGLVTNPNMLVAGEPGTGKSATVKAFVHRAVAVFGRWAAIADPKGEYRILADALGLDVIDLHPGGTSRINPLDTGPTGVSEAPEELARRHATMVAALLGSVLGRDLTPLEDAALGWALTELARDRHRVVTLADIAQLLATPSEDMANRAHVSIAELARSVEAATYALGKLLDRSLRGMFDSPTNVHLDWDGPGVVIDLSSVHHDPEALRLVMVATTAWLQTVMARPDGPPRLQVLDEAWSLLATERTSRYLQACWKLGRSYGVANVAVVHRLSDLRSQADDGTTTAKVAMGLLADTQTRVLFRQAPDQLADARSLLGLTGPEAALLGQLARARSIWRVGSRAAVVATAIGPTEAALVDTDARMAA